MTAFIDSPTAVRGTAASLSQGHAQRGGEACKGQVTGAGLNSTSAL